MPALLPNSLIVITGLSGYIASHAGLWVLKSGHRLRGTVRSWARAQSLRAGYENHGIPTTELDNRLEFVIVDDLCSEVQWSHALRDVDGVIHTALAIDKLMSPEVIPEAVANMLALLRAAKEVLTLKRVVFTSSIAAVITPPITYDRVLTPDDWNDEAVDTIENDLPVDHDPIRKRASPVFFYSAAKVKAERAALEFVNQTSFDFVSILPGTNVGPMIHGEPASTTKWVSNMLKGDASASRILPNQWFVDVRDCGKLHFLALTTPSMGGKRFFACAEPFEWNQIFRIFRTHFPDAPVADVFEGNKTYTQELDIGASTEVLGSWIGLEQSLVDLGKSLGY